MALKRKIDKEAYGKLAKDVQANYTADGDNYLLDLEGLDDVDELRRAKDRETENAKKLRKELKDLKEKLEELEANAPDPGEKDIKKLDAAHQATLKKLKDEATARETELAAKLAAKDAHTKKTMIDNAALQLATKISTVPTLMSKAIADRLTVDFEGDEPKLIVLGSDGKNSALTLDQLAKEFSTNKEYASIVVGSKASGSGAPRNGSELKPSGASASDSKPPDLAKMEPKSLVETLREKVEANREAARNQTR